MGKTVSVTMGKGSLNHNNRAFHTENVDPTFTPNNVILQQQTLKEAYTEIFGAALEAYNEKQKRNDRKIPDYLEHIRKSGNGEKLFHELVVQVGNREDTGVHTPDAQAASELLNRYYYEFQERNPNLRVFNAIIHMDELDGTPHLHLDFIPTASGQKRGLETKNSMRQALEQLGYDYRPIPVNDNPDISVNYGKPQPKIGGGRWLEAERAALGGLLEQSGIEWDKMGTHRAHQTVREFKACAELIAREVAKTPSAPLELRTPTPPMKFAGVKADEVVVRRADIEGLQQENVTLRVQAEVNRKTIAKMDADKAGTDVFVQRAIKTADMEKHRAVSEAERVKAAYSDGTATKYRALAEQSKRLVEHCRHLKARCETAESIPQQVEQAVTEAIRPLQKENHALRTEVETWKRQVETLQARVRSLCQTLYDTLRAVFTLKYNFNDKSPNPYRSELSAPASHLLDVLEDKARQAVNVAGHPELEKGLSGMGVAAELEREVNRRIKPVKKQGHEIGE